MMSKDVSEMISDSIVGDSGTKGIKIPEDRDSKSSTLCYIENEGCYLMLHRVVKEKDVNHDKWIGVGGHFEEGEASDECLLREIYEETGIRLADYRYRGLITFVPHEGSIELMHLYTGSLKGADMTESFTGLMDEGVLEWIPKDKVWDLELWEGDKIFFRLFEEEKDFENMLLAYDENDQLKTAELEGEPLELIDVIDEDGNPTGTVRERGVVHLLGTLHKTVHIWIMRKNDKSGLDVLLQKRSMTKDSNPGCYDISAAGHIQSGGGVMDAAVRETFEEIGLETEPEDFEFAGVHYGYYKGSFHGRPFNDNEMMHVFICNKEVDDRQLVLQESEVESVIWMDFEECKQMIHDEYMEHCIYEEEFDLVAEYLKNRND